MRMSGRVSRGVEPQLTDGDDFAPKFILVFFRKFCLYIFAVFRHRVPVTLLCSRIFVCRSRSRPRVDLK
jgi:hypothetical protein